MTRYPSTPRARGMIWAHRCEARGLHGCPSCWVARYVAAVLLAMACAFFAGCSSRPERTPVPDVAGELARNVQRVDLLAAQHMADVQLHAQATAYVLARAQRRASAIRVARRSP